MKKYFSFILLFTTLFFTPTFSYGTVDTYVWNNMSDISNSVTPTSSSILETSLDDSSNPLNLDCGSAILIEQTTGKILYSYNSHKQLRPASVTKLMSILLIMESIESGKLTYDTQIPCSKNAASMGRISNLA